MKSKLLHNIKSEVKYFCKMPEISAEPNENHELITEELVKNGLQKDKGENAELLSWNIKDFTSKGDGYTSFVTSVTVKYKKDEIQSEASYVVKLNPKRPPSPFSDMTKMMFPRETVILNDIIGAMNKHLERLFLEPLRTPKVFSSTMEDGKESFLAENLRTQGFQMHPKRQAQDVRHGLLVMEELGRFHASSLLLKESISPKSFEEKYENFEEFSFSPDSGFFKMFMNMIESQAEVAINFLREIPKYEKCVKWLQAHKQTLGQKFFEGYTPRKPFEVLVHGDCHTNNMLFKYNSMNEPIDVRLLDLQGCRLGSNASDIDYFAYSSLGGETRSKHFPKSWKDEVEDRKMLGLVTGIMTAQFLLVEEDEVVDLGEMREDNMEEFAEKSRKTFQRVSEGVIGFNGKDKTNHGLNYLVCLEVITIHSD
ncbi:hypothetical protein Anas_13176 [Armadillidium nasatum]|uniref:CHK kinase-like domain-containing protein n=1 Tax=Armadillidium nasatum TaxID=96803 RepID=A0A5N5T1E0_9CRUS|nr:hypothetical protein Anas_13176 [Armadillidium nasatum]